MENRLTKVNVLIDRGEPYRALGVFTRLTSFLNRGSQNYPKTILELMRWARRMQNTVAALARTLGAVSYSLGVSMPIGVSFNLSFPTYK